MKTKQQIERCLVGCATALLMTLAGCSDDGPNANDGTEGDSGDESGDETGFSDGAPDYACLLDADCGAGRSCVLGICVEGCQEDTDCASGETCNAHGVCEGESPDLPPSKPDAPLGDLSLVETETQLADGDTQAVVTLRNTGPVDVRFRLDAFVAGLSYDAAPRVLASGDEVELSVSLSSELLASDQVAMGVDIISDAGDLQWVVRLPGRRSGHFLGALSLAVNNNPIGSSDLGLNLTLNDDGTITGQTFDDESFLWPQDVVVTGTWTPEGAVDFRVEDVVAATASNGAQSPFGRDIAREAHFLGTFDFETRRIEGDVEVEFSGIADDAVRTEGTFNMKLTGPEREATSVEDQSALVPMSVPTGNWDDLPGVEACDGASALIDFVNGQGPTGCTGCPGDSCQSELLCAGELLSHGYGIEELLASNNFADLKVEWEGCRDGGHVYSLADDQACFDAAALSCAGYLLRKDFEENHTNPTQQAQIMKGLLDQVSAFSGGGSMVATEREIQAVLAFREPSSTIATELSYLEGALSIIEEPMRTISQPGYVRGLAMLGLNEIHVAREDKDLLRSVDLIERYSDLKMVQLRLRARQAGALSVGDADELRYQGIWVHALAAYWNQQLEYFEVEDDAGAIASIGAIARNYREDYVSFSGSTNPYGLPDDEVPVRLGVNVSMEETNYGAVKASLVPLLTNPGGLVMSVQELVAAEDAFWQTTFQASTARQEIIEQYDAQLISICGSVSDPMSGLEVPDIEGCGQNGLGTLAELQSRLKSAELEIDRAFEAWLSNEQLASIESDRMAEILENFDMVQMDLDGLRDEMFGVMDSATMTRMDARNSHAKNECERIKKQSRERNALGFIGKLPGLMGSVATGGYQAAASALFEQGVQAAAGKADSNYACQAAQEQGFHENAMDQINAWETEQITVINNMIDDLLRQSSYDEQVINSKAAVRSIRVRDGELQLTISQAGSQFETTFIQLQTEVQRVVTTLQAKERALARFDANPAHGPQHLMARLESARRVLTLREGIYRTLFELIRAVEYEVNREAPLLRDGLSELRSPNAVDDFLVQCLDWSVNEYLDLVGDPGTLTQEISLRNDVFKYDEDLIDSATGEVITPGEQFRALLRDPRNQGTGLQGNRVVSLPFTFSLSDDSSLFSYNTCDDRILTVGAMVVGDFVGDNEIDLSLNRSGVTYLRRCDAVPEGSMAARELVNEYGFAEARTTVRAGANQFGVDANTAYAGWPIGGDNWTVELDFNLPANQDLTLEHISDLVLRIQLDSRDVNPNGGLANYSPGCF